MYSYTLTELGPRDLAPNIPSGASAGSGCSGRPNEPAARQSPAAGEPGCGLRMSRLRAIFTHQALDRPALHRMGTAAGYVTGRYLLLWCASGGLIPGLVYIHPRASQVVSVHGGVSLRSVLTDDGLLSAHTHHLLQCGGM